MKTHSMQIDEPQWGETILSCCQSLGVEAGPRAVEVFRVHARLLLDWAGKMNLTAVTDPAEIARRHFADSLAMVPHLPERAGTLLDVGSGAGFPGIPVKAVRPELFVTLIDSARKKVSFQKTVIRACGLDRIEAIQERAEDLAKTGRRFDVVCARAVTELEKLWALASPLLPEGGALLALKGKNAPDEAETLFKKTGIRAELFPYQLPGSGVLRHVAVITGKGRDAL